MRFCEVWQVMAELLSVGLDVGTTTTQMIVSRLTVENKASSFAVPQMQITGRNILYRGAVQFTPLLDKDHVDGAALAKLVTNEYEKAGITPAQVDTGAIIITGETSRKENAKAVLDALATFAGEFVVTTAGPHLESVLAAKGAGATDYSEKTGKSVLHMDIGGGTANLAWIENGRIVNTGCLNVGGRLLKLDESGYITYVSPVLAGLTPLQVGQLGGFAQIQAITQQLVSALEMAAGLIPATGLIDKLWTVECGSRWEEFPRVQVISFSGGVADCINKDHPPFAFGDIGPVLGKAIRESRLCQGQYRLGEETIRATVIGAGCHSAQLSGSTVFWQNVDFPMKNLPVVHWDGESKPAFPEDQAGVLAMEGLSAPTYEGVKALAQKIVNTGVRPVLVAVEKDMAKALGHALSLLLPKDTPVLCVDRVGLGEDSYLDVGVPVGPCLPVVVKTLVLAKDQ